MEKFNKTFCIKCVSVSAQSWKISTRKWMKIVERQNE